MSKIQKALEALRLERDAEALARRNAEKFMARHGPNDFPVNHGKSRAPVRRDATATPGLQLEAFEELPVPGKAEIDLERLRQAGLLPSSRDENVIDEQFRRAKRPLLYSAFDSGLPIGENANVIMVTSAMPGAGKSFCSFNLARSIARERDIGAVLVDADVLKGSITRDFGLADRPGLIDFLLDRSLQLDDVLVETDFSGVVVLPSGRRHPEATELLSSLRMKQVVTELSKRFRNRIVLFDAPPLLITNEAHVLASHVGQVVLIIESRSSSQESVLQALGALDRDKPINAILNKSRTATAGGYHGDDYGYYPFHAGRRDHVEKSDNRDE